MKNIFSQLTPNSTLEEIDRFVLSLKNKIVADDEEETDDNNAPSEILREKEEPEEPPESKDEVGVEEDPNPVVLAQLDMLRQSIDQLADYVTKFQNETDRTALPVLKQVVSRMNLDYKSAYELTTFYTKGWFSRSFMSIEGKAQFASFLIDTVLPYCKSNLETWQMIRDRDPDMILYISWPRNDNSGA